jgi:hypothetical protein
MPPRNIDTPVHLRPFVAHGLDVFKQSDTEATGECPFCGKDKFFVGLKDVDVKKFAGGWSCHVCGVGGNIGQFLERVWSESWRFSRPSSEVNALVSLGEERGLPPQHLRAMGVCKSITTGEWIVPGYGGSGTIVNLFRWKPIGDGRNAMMATPGEGVLNLGYFRPNEVPADYDRVDVVEGVWDAAAWRWALSEADPARLDRTLIVGVPGCNVWTEAWGTLCAGKVVTILFDNDHPRTNPKTGVVTQPALAGVKRTAGMLASYSDPPKSVSYLCWGGDSGYHDEVITSGYDLRDVVKNSGDVGSVAGQVDAMVRPVPAEWSVVVGVSSPKSTDALRSTKCTSWNELLEAWKTCDHLNPEFEKGLLFSMCVAGGVEYGECRLWGKLVGVGGTGKSTICDGISTARHHVVEESIITDMYSGCRTEDGKDHSFAARINGMCWVNNDTDTLLKNNRREVVLAQLRDLYGGHGSKAFNNGLGSRTYHGMKFGVLLAGTPSIRELDSAELGGRFLDFVFEKPDEATKRRIAMSAMRRQTSGVVSRSNMTPDKERATRMTGGLVEHVRKNHKSLTDGVQVTDEQMHRIYDYANYIASVRARRPKNQDEEIDAVEMPTRLSMQLVGLAVMASAVRGRKCVDIGSMALVRRVAIDTAKGRTQKIIDAVAQAGRVGLDVPSIVKITNRDAELDYQDVLFMSGVGILEMYSDVVSLSSRARWRLSPSFAGVYKAVFPNGGV